MAALFAAVARTRESLADKTGAELRGGPEVLAQAIRELDRDLGGTVMAEEFSETTSEIGRLLNEFVRLLGLFMSYPPSQERVARRRDMLSKPWFTNQRESNRAIRRHARAVD